MVRCLKNGRLNSYHEDNSTLQFPVGFFRIDDRGMQIRDENPERCRDWYRRRSPVVPNNAACASQQEEAAQAGRNHEPLAT